MSKRISSLHFYPIKGCKATDLKQASVGRMGPEMDRRWMIVDPAGRFISQRQEPRMALIDPRVEKGRLLITIPNEMDCSIFISNEGEKRPVSVWDDVCLAIDQGDVAAEKLSRFLERECRLVFMPDSTSRPVNPKYTEGLEKIVGFADRFSFLFISEGSLEDLNRRLAQPVPMNRFRPNLVISGCKPFEEDQWKRIRIGEIVFKRAKPCTRCTVITVDQATGIKGEEPLRTLASYRKGEKGIEFGQNMIHLNQGVLSVGDAVEVLE